MAAMTASNSTLWLKISYDSQRLEATFINRMTKHLENLLAGFVDESYRQLSELPLLSLGERRQIIEEWNRTGYEYERAGYIHELFEEQVARTPEAVALLYEDEQLTYAEVNGRANQLAHYLRELGVGAEVRVGVLMERSVELVISLLGILKAGAAYVPLEPGYPRERLAYMMADAGVPVLLTQSRFAAQWATVVGVQVVSVDGEREELGRRGTGNLGVGLSDAHLAYVIYTSGSTGAPKGAMNTHGGIRNRLLWMQQQYELRGGERVLQKTPFSFDVSVWEFFWPLLSGATVVVARPGGHQDGGYLVELIARAEITTLHFVPSMLAVFVAEAGLERCVSVRQVISSGEALSSALAGRVRERWPWAALDNLYGPTEAAVDVSWWRCEAAEVGAGRSEGQEPIGRPIANTRLYVLDGAGEVVPVGVAGELYLGGAGLARGYLNGPELTAEKFIPDRYSGGEGQRLYRTGDLCRYLANGAVAYLGRLDFQVKLRGFRIELGEVEAALVGHAAVREAVVVVRTEAGGQQRLVGYVVCAGEAVPGSSELREYLGERLPEYMVPGVYVVLEQLPLTANGKVDRRALPAPEQVGGKGAPSYEGPRNETEAVLARIWATVLGRERVSVHDNFFEVGGDSILSLQIVARARAQGLHLLPRQLFEQQSVAALAAVVGTSAAVEAEQGEVTGMVPLTPIQRWFFAQELETPEHWNQALLLAVSERLEAASLGRAVQALLAQHDALRLRFEREAGEWQQVNLSVAAAAASGSNGAGAVPLSVHDLTGLPEEEQRERVEREAARLQTTLHLSAGPLLRVAWFELGAGRGGRLLLVLHHLVVDGVSWRVLLEDLERGYRQAQQGEAISLGAKTSSYQRWAEQLQRAAGSAEVLAELPYWEEQLGRRGAEVVSLPVDYGGGENLERWARVESRRLSRAETRQLIQEVPAAYHTQITEVLLTALVGALGEWRGDGQVVVDVEGHGREAVGSSAGSAAVEVTRTVGWFTSIYPVRLVGASRELGERLKAVKEQVRGIPQRGVGYGLLRWLSPAEAVRERMAELEAAEVSFNYLGQLDQVLEAESVLSIAPESVGAMHGSGEQRAYLVEVTASVIDGELQVGWRYSERVHQRETIVRVAERYMEELRQIIAHCLSADAGGYTPSDFPIVKLTQLQLDSLTQKHHIEDVYPLSLTQEGILYHCLYEPDIGMYSMQLSCILEGDLNFGAFQLACEQVVNRHSILRTAFVWEGQDQPLQVVGRQASLPVHVLDWSGLSASQQQLQLQELLTTDRERGFELSKAPLMRLTLVRLDALTHHFIWSHHHLLLDGWSVPLLLKEVFTAYEAARLDQPLSLPVPRPYRDYILWLKQQDLGQAEQYWRKTLRGFSAPTRLDIERRTTAEAAERYGEQQVRLSREATEQLQQYGRREQVTVNTLVQGAWALLLSRYSGQQDVVFGATVSGRPAELAGAEQMVGLFINTLPVRVQVNGEEGLREWLRGLQRAQVEARQYEYSPLAEIQRWSEVERGVGLFETLVVFENFPIDESLRQQNSSLSVDQLQAFAPNNYLVTLTALPGQELLLRIEYDGSRFTLTTIKRMLGLLETLLTGMAVHAHEQLKVS